MVFETSLLLLRFDLRSEIKFRFERVVETQQVIIIRQMYKEEVEKIKQSIIFNQQAQQQKKWTTFEKCHTLKSIIWDKIERSLRKFHNNLSWVVATSYQIEQCHSKFCFVIFWNELELVMVLLSASKIFYLKSLRERTITSASGPNKQFFFFQSLSWPSSSGLITTDAREFFVLDKRDGIKF